LPSTARNNVDASGHERIVQAVVDQRSNRTVAEQNGEPGGIRSCPIQSQIIQYTDIFITLAFQCVSCKIVFNSIPSVTVMAELVR
jgi:hypothetical protein